MTLAGAGPPRESRPNQYGNRKNRTALSLAHQPAMSAEKRWRRLRGFRYLTNVIAAVCFIDGVNDRDTGRRAAPRFTMHKLNSILNSYLYISRLEKLRIIFMKN